MACSVDDFTINRNLKNEFYFTIKKDKELLPIVIDPSDTFRLILYDIHTDNIEIILDSSAPNENGEIIVSDYVNGQIKVTMNETMTSALKKERGSREERYYLKPTYKMIIEANTASNGILNPKIDRVFVD